VRGKINFWLQRSNLKNVDRIITISETSKKDIVRFLGYPQDKIDVLYLAARNVFRHISDAEKLKKVKEKFDLPDRFVLYVGDVNYNKNISALIKACQNLDLFLLIVGKQAFDIGQGEIGYPLRGPSDWLRFFLKRPHPEIAHFKELFNLFSTYKKVKLAGFVDENDLVAIYNLATVYCQPSFYEGFGMPVLEAMACGTPVLAAKINALQEIAGDAALFFDPYNVSDLAENIKSIFENTYLRKDLIKKGRVKARDFSWLKTAQDTLKVYEKILV